MKSKYITVVLVSLVFLGLFFASSYINYSTSVESTQKQLKLQSLPLATDNIHSEIKKHISQSLLVSSMMADDTFLKDWIMSKKTKEKEIKNYLDSIKSKNKLLKTFLISEKTKKYYTQDGFIEDFDESDPTNQWYYDFKDVSRDYEIRLTDIETPRMSVLYKIFDDNYNFLGATGINLNITYLNTILREFKDKYKLNVCLIDSEANIISPESYNRERIDHYTFITKLDSFKTAMQNQETTLIEYSLENDNFIVNLKYVKELDIFIIAELNFKDFIKSEKNMLTINVVISIVLALVLGVILLLILNKYTNKIEVLGDFDDLTEIPNRKNFTTKFEHFLLLSKRTKEPLSLLFIDLDDFRKINDKYGHHIGDKVLKEFANILQKNIRATDIRARWGGEEFVVAFVDISPNKAVHISNKIRKAVKDSKALQKLVDPFVTISCGVTECNNEDTMYDVITRADQAMNNAKTGGKNMVSVI